MKIERGKNLKVVMVLVEKKMRRKLVLTLEKSFLDRSSTSPRK